MGYDEDQHDSRQSQPKTETDERFPSGPWVGFWLQRPLVGRQWMRDLWLRFAQGRVNGGGVDCVGEFRFDGRYDLKTGRVMLIKQYLGAHTVQYDGRNENDGQWIWGVWRMREIGQSGGFHMWPKGVADPTQRRLADEVDAPAEERAEAAVGAGRD